MNAWRFCARLRKAASEKGQSYVRLFQIRNCLLSFCKWAAESQRVDREPAEESATRKRNSALKLSVRSKDCCDEFEPVGADGL
jgi:hypothetical protein